MSEYVVLIFSRCKVKGLMTVTQYLKLGYLGKHKQQRLINLHD